MAIITKTIGIGGTHDFATLAAWKTANGGSATSNLTGDGNSIVGQTFFNGSGDGEFTGSTNLLDISGFTTGISNTITLTTGTGQSFRDNAGVLTNPLIYNSANGVAITSSVGAGGSPVSLENDNVFISNLQLKNSSSNGFALSAIFGASNVTINNCIMTSTGLNAALDIGMNAGVSVNNCLIYVTGASNTNRIVEGEGGAITFNYCTFVATPGSGPPAWIFDGTAPTTFTCVNCAFFGTTGIVNVANVTGVFTTCITDVASPPTGCTTVSFGAQFQNTTTDFRQVVHNNGTPVGGITTDIAGQARDATHPNIGAWEVASSSTGVPVWLYFGQSLALGAGAKLARDLIRNPIRSRRRLLTGRDDK